MHAFPNQREEKQKQSCGMTWYPSKRRSKTKYNAISRHQHLVWMAIWIRDRDHDCEEVKTKEINAVLLCLVVILYGDELEPGDRGKVVRNSMSGTSLKMR